MLYKKTIFTLTLFTTVIILPMNEKQPEQESFHDLTRCKSMTSFVGKKSDTRRSISSPLFPKSKKTLFPASGIFFEAQSPNNWAPKKSLLQSQESLSSCDITPASPVSAVRMLCLHLLHNEQPSPKHTVDSTDPIFGSDQFMQSPNYQLFKLCQDKHKQPADIIHEAMDLLDLGANPNYTINSASLLQTAIMHAQKELIELLIAYGATPSEQDVELTSVRIAVSPIQTERRRGFFGEAHEFFFNKDKRALLEILNTLKKKITPLTPENNNA